MITVQLRDVLIVGPRYQHFMGPKRKLITISHEYTDKFGPVNVVRVFTTDKQGKALQWGGFCLS